MNGYIVLDCHVFKGFSRIEESQSDRYAVNEMLSRQKDLTEGFAEGR
jgi:hypothetical protein